MTLDDGAGRFDDGEADSAPTRVSAGTRIWVEANFKDNQLDRMRVGQAATFKVDAFPDQKLTGRLRTFSPGTDTEHRRHLSAGS